MLFVPQPQELYAKRIYNHLGLSIDVQNGESLTDEFDQRMKASGLSGVAAWHWAIDRYRVDGVVTIDENHYSRSGQSPVRRFPEDFFRYMNPAIHIKGKFELTTDGNEIKLKEIKPPPGCPKCQHPGEFVRMALCCPTHGAFGGI